jgi:uncharacterized protein (DUF486 family)
MKTAILLVISNVFMTVAWYGQLSSPKFFKASLPVVILVSWGIAFFEYCFQVPANRIGSLEGLSAGKLKVMQEAITLVVFTVFAATVLREKLTWNYFVGMALVFAGVCFVFYSRGGAAR